MEEFESAVEYAGEGISGTSAAKRLEFLKIICECRQKKFNLVPANAIAIVWTRNVFVLEAEMMLGERAWYIRAVRQFGWSKVELQRKIDAKAHLELVLDFVGEMCYTEEKVSFAEDEI